MGRATRSAAGLILTCMATVPVVAQDPPPGTEIYIVPLARAGVGEPGARSLTVGEPRRVTDRQGYDNQPAFTPDGSGLLFTSVDEDDQADTWRYDIEARRLAQVTRTAESEYSPLVTPRGDRFSVVRVEADDRQRLWQFALDGGEPRLVLEQVQPVGYHAWIDDERLMLFVLGDPAELHVANATTGESQLVAADIERSLALVPGRRTAVFLQRREGIPPDAVGDESWWVMELDLATLGTRPLVRSLVDSRDFAWTPDGTLLMANGSVLHGWDGDPAEGWYAVADFASYGMVGITRLAVSPAGDWLALVVEEAPPR